MSGNHRTRRFQLRTGPRQKAQLRKRELASTFDSAEDVIVRKPDTTQTQDTAAVLMKPTALAEDNKLCLLGKTGMYPNFAPGMPYKRSAPPSGTPKYPQPIKTAPGAFPYEIRYRK